MTARSPPLLIAATVMVPKVDEATTVEQVRRRLGMGQVVILLIETPQDVPGCRLDRMAARSRMASFRRRRSRDRAWGRSRLRCSDGPTPGGVSLWLRRPRVC